ncbi:MAG: hypothetical protein JEZ04_03700 [Spirochaetales bacterium]|nr:hypothetical protein [Spirochaetales bacterium]
MNNNYVEDFKTLSQLFDISKSSTIVNIEGHKEFEIQSLPFTSASDYVYPDTGDYSGKGSAFTSLLKYYVENNQYSKDLIFGTLEKSDKQVHENSHFRIPVFKPSGPAVFDRATILLHGLNEKHWDKYLTWALRLMEDTGSPVILFPIAFHMNRAPKAWGNSKDMIRVAAERKKLVCNSTETSFLNAALSHRIQFAPHRFFSSGMQTYYDIIQFANEVRMGANPYLSKNCRIDFFAYSVGASLAEVLMTSNQNGFFDESRAFLFCGGAALDTAAPVSKTIIDSEAYNELFSWFGSLFNSASDIGKKVKGIFFQDLPEVLNFKSFLFFDKMQSFRESALKKAGNRISGISLNQDSVFTPESTNRTLNGFSGDININTENLDFPFAYRHEDPFPLLRANQIDVNSSFNRIFSKVSNFLNKSA